MRVRFSDIALGDLEGIALYIGRGSEDAARRVINRIEETCFSLREFSGLGLLSEIPPARKLFIPGLPYKIVYEIKRRIAVVVILRVYHEARNTEY